MLIEYDIKKISGMKKSLCVGDLIKYYGETAAKTRDKVKKLNESNDTKGMIASILRKAMNNQGAQMVMDNIQESAKKNIFSFKIDDINLLTFDNHKETCVIEVEMIEEYFVTHALWNMMTPGFRKMSYEQHIEKEKERWLKWFEKNLRNDYTTCYTKKILEK